MVEKIKKHSKTQKTNDSLLRVPFSVNKTEKSVLIAQHISFCFLASEAAKKRVRAKRTPKNTFSRVGDDNM